MSLEKNSTNEYLNCEYITQCSGCQIATLDKNSQIEFKINHFSELWKKAFGKIPEIEFSRPTESQFRDRIDITIERDNLSQSAEEGNIADQKIGFYKKDSRDILDIARCPLLSDATQKLYADIRKINFPIKKGSIRLRVSPSGLKGVWVDFSNEDIKKLLDEKTTLNNLSKICDVIEIGQKRKRLSMIKGNSGSSDLQFKLSDPQFEKWFETYDKNLNPIALEMNVGSFSQTGFKTNKELIRQLLGILKDAVPTAADSDQTSTIAKSHNKISSFSDDSTWLELCSGSGNLTFPLLSVVSNVISTELDENAVESLKITAKNLNLSQKLQVEKINVHKPSDRLKALLSNVDGILADPPRSGLQGFVEVLADCDSQTLPKNFIYISCFAETLILDIKSLENFDYRVEKIVAVDQFPHSSHCEWITHLKK